MFNRKKIESLKSDIETLKKQYFKLEKISDLSFKYLIKSANDKYFGKYFKMTEEIYYFYGKKIITTFIKVNTICHNDEKLVINCTCIENREDYFNLKNEDFDIINGVEITEKEFQDAYIEYSKSIGLLPKEGCKTEIINENTKK